ncbi:MULTISPECIES: hypothetical protein [unclassified Tolypothrix]|uniref:hypothetical protein n=1 Tax=unclassified Tolypothrix TaxID=2649714 RepID=UPI0005EAB5DA|nr:MULTISPECIES: hypothetical protein [unclassified Tolypothrix]BAY89462.1 hypothetical protein NIES3275_14650 [Microchaete diplosiphon NIES-3275]EKF01804.1 hypothetical protein FDUTEX481_07409 [Tolypothrix sp. PCC 7601]MBE9083738.1 hypothetical protein [Tolypothrix sp. LEGE 11397]UYD23749.1 hypothetical protein HGR01_19755 [Tolypothrix sp. PCC 7712]UYD34026.1 hypothetical protein HG267_35005 [Tolypothrix sp. PCC 7601]
MNNFKLKSLGFYGATIAGVLILFKAVSAYGESNLKAPPVINGSYRLTFDEKLPNCNPTEAPILKIQQSGIYVNASLLAADANSENTTSSEKNHSLSGDLNNQELTLSGKVDGSILCNIASTQNAPFHSAKMQMQLLDKGNFAGQLTVSGSSQSFKFTAIPQKTQGKSQSVKKH